MNNLSRICAVLAVAGVCWSGAALADPGPRGRGAHDGARQHRPDHRGPRGGDYRGNHNPRWSAPPQARHRDWNRSRDWDRHRPAYRQHYRPPPRPAWRAPPRYYAPRPHYRPYYRPYYRPWPGSAYYGGSRCYGGAGVQIWVDGFGFSYYEPCY